MHKKFTFALIMGLFVAPLTAQAQEVPLAASAYSEAEDAEIAAEQAALLRAHVMTQQRVSHASTTPLKRGEILPPEGITYYEIPEEFKRPHARYTVISGHVVLVNPKTNKIIQVLD